MCVGDTKMWSFHKGRDKGHSMYIIYKGWCTYDFIELEMPTKFVIYIGKIFWEKGTAVWMHDIVQSDYSLTC